MPILRGDRKHGAEGKPMTPLADGRRGVVLVLTDEYSRKTVMRAMPASR